MTGYLFSKTKSFLQCRKGMGAVEFAVLSPLLILILAGIVELGGAISTRYSMAAALTAGSHYVLSNGAKADSKSGADLMAKALVLVAEGLDPERGTASATINGEPAATFSKGIVTQGKQSSKFDQCFCPAAASGSVNWGTALSCGSPCSGGGYSGKFVEVTMSQPSVRLFKGILDLNGSISVQSTVQVQ